MAACPKWRKGTKGQELQDKLIWKYFGHYTVKNVCRNYGKKLSIATVKYRKIKNCISL